MKVIRILFFLAFVLLLFHMSFGTFTRSSGSGLSMTQWHLFDISLYPTEEKIKESYIEYKKIPQFAIQNFWMEFKDFRGIFFVEWFHRLCGKIIGLLCLVIFIVSLFPHLHISRSLRVYLFFILILVCFQGYLGWKMVMTGVTCDYTFDGLCTSVSSASLFIHSVMSYVILIFFSLLLFYMNKKSFLLRKHKRCLLVFVLYCILFIFFLLQVFLGTKLSSISVATSKKDLILPIYNLFLIFKNSGFQAFLYAFNSNEYLIYKHMINGILIILLSCAGAIVVNTSGVSIFNIYTLLIFLLMLQIFLGYYIAYINKVWYTQTLHQFMSTLLLVFSLRCAYDAFVSFMIKD